MVIFWNFAGVPFVCHVLSSWWQLANRTSVIHILCRVYGYTRPIKLQILDPCLCVNVRYPAHCLLYVRHFRIGIDFPYWQRCWRSWDTSMSQKSRFKMQTQGVFEYRRTFPQLPWGTLKEPSFIQTAHGSVASLVPPGSCFNRFIVTVCWPMAGGDTLASRYVNYSGRWKMITNPRPYCRITSLIGRWVSPGVQ